MLSRLLRLFGAGGAEAPAEEPVEYKGYRIVAAPVKEAAGWRVAALITGEVDGEERTHHLTRADVFADRAVVVQMSVEKARRVVDEQGERMFEQR